MTTHRKERIHGSDRKDPRSGFRRAVQPADRPARARPARVLRDTALHHPAQRHPRGRLQGRHLHRRAEQRLPRGIAPLFGGHSRSGHSRAGHLLRRAADGLDAGRKDRARAGPRIWPRGDARLPEQPALRRAAGGERVLDEPHGLHLAPAGGLRRHRPHGQLPLRRHGGRRPRAVRGAVPSRGDPLRIRPADPAQLPVPGLRREGRLGDGQLHRGDGIAPAPGNRRPGRGAGPVGGAWTVRWRRRF